MNTPTPTAQRGPLVVEPEAPAHVISPAELRRLTHGHSPLESRLRGLRRRSRTGARTATVMSTFSAALMGGLMLLVGGGMVAGFMALSGQLPGTPTGLPPVLRMVLLGEMLIIPPILLFALLRALTQIFTARKLFAHYYRNSLAWLERHGAALYYVNEEFHQLLEEARQASIGWVSFFQPRQRPRSFEQQLEYLACSGELLRRSAELRPVRSRFEFAWAWQIFTNQWMFQVPLGLWLGLIGLGLLPFIGLLVTLGVMIATGPQSATMPAWMPVVMPLTPLSMLLWVLPTGLSFQMGPRYVISRARLTALLDYLLDEPRIDPAGLPEPPSNLGWWARQTAPWRCRERAPD